LTRQSIIFVKISFAKRMDARVRPGHDEPSDPFNLVPMGTSPRMTERSARAGTRFGHLLLLIAAVVALALHAQASLAAEGTKGKGIRFWNLTSSTVTRLYLSPAGKDAFGPDQCKNDPDGAVDHDERVKVVGVASGQYDLRVTQKSGRVCLVKNVTIEDNKVFSVEDKDLTECSQ